MSFRLHGLQTSRAAENYGTFFAIPASTSNSRDLVCPTVAVT